MIYRINSNTRQFIFLKRCFTDTKTARHKKMLLIYVRFLEHGHSIRSKSVRFRIFEKDVSGTQRKKEERLVPETPPQNEISGSESFTRWLVSLPISPLSRSLSRPLSHPLSCSLSCPLSCPLVSLPVSPPILLPVSPPVSLPVSLPVSPPI